jgi:hypothetical protein
MQVVRADGVEIRQKSKGRRWIRTSNFHRVKMVPEAEKRTPQALSVSVIPVLDTDFKGSVH